MWLVHGRFTSSFALGSGDDTVETSSNLDPGR
jgi:hypothetical protein